MFELPTKLQVFELLAYVMSDAERVVDAEFLPANPFIIDTARQNDKRGAKIEMIVPDEWVKNLNGLREFKDAFIMVRVPREVVLDHVEDKTQERVVSGPTKADPASESAQTDAQDSTGFPANSTGTPSISEEEK